MTEAPATLWPVLQHGILAVGALLGALAVIVTVLRRSWRSGRRLATQVRDVHAVILGDDDQPSLVQRLQHGDRRMARIEDDLKFVKGGQQEIKRRVKSVEQFVDVLGSEDRIEVRKALQAASNRGREGDERERRRA